MSYFPFIIYVSVMISILLFFMYLTPNMYYKYFYLGLKQNWHFLCKHTVSSRGMIFLFSEAARLLWGSLSPLCSRYHQLCHWGMKLTSHFHLLLRLRMSEDIAHILSQQQRDFSLFNYTHQHMHIYILFKNLKFTLKHLNFRLLKLYTYICSCVGVCN